MKLTRKNKNPYLFMLIVFAVIAVTITSYLRPAIARLPIGIALPWWLEAVCSVAIFFTFYLWLEKYLWKLPLMHFLGVVNFPKLSGRWVGFLTSSYRRDGQNVVVPISLEISQNASFITIRACFERAYSDSVIAEIKEIQGRTRLYYVYDNTISDEPRNHLGHDRGVVMLEYTAEDEKRLLKGTYFNDAQPHPNHGEIEVLYSGAKLYYH